MSNLKVLTNLDSKQDIYVSGSHKLHTTASFNMLVATSSDGMYDVDGAMHALDVYISSSYFGVQHAYQNVRLQYTSSFDAQGNTLLNLTSLSPSGTLYFASGNLQDVNVQVLVDTDNNSHYKNDLVSIELYPSGSSLMANIDAPTSANKPYRLLVINETVLPISFIAGSNDAGNNGNNTTLNTDLIAYFSLNGSPGDQKNNYSGSFNNTVAYGEEYGKVSQGAYLPGNRYITLTPNINLSSTDWSVSLWVNQQYVSGYQALFGESTNAAVFFAGINSSESSLIVWVNNGEPFGAISFVNNTWYHLVITYNNSTNTYRLYVNGVLNPTSINKTSFVIKQIGANGTNGETYNGYMDEVGIWNRIITQQEVTDLYNAGNGRAYSAF